MWCTICFIYKCIENGIAPCVHLHFIACSSVWLTNKLQRSFHHENAKCNEKQQQRQQQKANRSNGLCFTILCALLKCDAFINGKHNKVIWKREWKKKYLNDCFLYAHLHFKLNNFIPQKCTMRYRVAWYGFQSHFCTN